MRDARGMRPLLVTDALTINESLSFFVDKVFGLKNLLILPYYTSWLAFIKKKKTLDLIEGGSIQLSKYSAPVDLILGPETRVSFSKYLSFVKIIYIANIKIFMR